MDAIDEQQQGIVEQQPEAVQGDASIESSAVRPAEAAFGELEDHEDYGPLKKKLKYHREERSSGSLGAHPNPTLDDNVDDTATATAADPSLEPATAAEPINEPTQGDVIAATKDEQHADNLVGAGQEQTQSQDISHAPQSGSPSSATGGEKSRKHNFYVPSRELAFLLDSGLESHEGGTAPDAAASGDAQTGAAPVSSASATQPAGSFAQLGLPASGLSSRQAAKIAAMEAKEAARIQKEKDAEELRAKRKATADAKKAEAAKKKNAKAEAASPPLNAGEDESAPAVATTAKPKRSGSSRRPARIKQAKQASPELEAPKAFPASASPASASPAQAAGSLPAQAAAVGEANDLAVPELSQLPPPNATLPNGSPEGAEFANIELPPMPEPADAAFFIPYASEGARAAAAAKAAKQARAQQNAAAAAAAAGLPVPGEAGSSTNPAAQAGTSRSNAGGSRKRNTGGANSNGAAAQSIGGIPPVAGDHLSAGPPPAKRARGDAGSKGNSRSAAAKGKAAAAASATSGRASPVSTGFEQANGQSAAGGADVNALAAQAAYEAPQEEEEVDDRLYCICQQLYDEERLMIACDRCNNWYHADCLAIDENTVNLIDLFVCPVCEKESGQRTVYKSSCVREGCTEPARKLSRYCSDFCGVAVAAAKLGLERPTGNGAENLEVLWDAISSVKKREAVVRAVDEDAVLAAAEESTEGVSAEVEELQRLKSLQWTLEHLVQNRQAFETRLSLAEARATYLQNIAVVRYERLSAKAKEKAGGDAASGAGTSNKKAPRSRTGKGTTNPDAPCAFDVRLIWNDAQLQEWLESEEGTAAMVAAREGGPAAVQYLDTADESDMQAGLVCETTRRKCDRHSGWMETRRKDYATDIKTLTKQLDSVGRNEREARRRMEDTQDLINKRREKAARNLLNGKQGAVAGNQAGLDVRIEGDTDMERA